MQICGALITLGGMICAPSAFAAPHSIKKLLVKVAEHVSLGAATELGVAHAGARRHADWAAGLVAVGVVAAAKEGSDAIAGRDTIRQAAWHASMIALGGGIAAAVDQH